jgi:ATP-dependent Lon protease
MPNAIGMYLAFYTQVADCIFLMPGGNMGKKGYAKILAVDDEKIFLQLLSHTLQKEGYEIRTASDGPEAIRRLEQEKFDLALIDVRMTPMDGLAVLEDIKKRYPHTKVIIITAYPTGETRRLSFQQGAVQYLTKPIEIQDLKLTIRQALACLDKGLAKD